MAAVALAPSPLPRRLRVGVFADARLQPRWVIDAFARVAASEFAEIAVICAKAREPAPDPWLWRLYGSVDRWAFGERAHERLDLAEHVPHGKLVQCEAGVHDLDVAFALGDIDDTRLDGLARYGVWRFWFGPQRADSEAQAGRREVVEGAAVSGSGLKARLHPGQPARIAYQSWSRTYPFSVARNRDRVLRKTAQFAWRALRELHRSGHGWLEHLAPAREPAAAPLGSSELLRGLGHIGQRILERGVQKALYVDQWFLAFRFDQDGGRTSRGGGGTRPDPDLQGFTRIVPPRDRDWADPFPIERNGRHYVFFEELPYAAGKAHISMLEVRRDGSWSAPVKVLERDYHLSYPFLLEHDGALFMVPETGRNGTVELYRCVEFPHRWRLERVLLEGFRCVDATLHRGPDRWWMFVNAASGDTSVFDDELHLFHAERLTGEWRPHDRNPIKSDVRCSRPAGALYRHGGALYRPAQICVPLYGAGLSINRVLQLTPHQYVERQVERVLPARQAGILGLHTLNRAGDLTVIDAFTRQRRLNPWK